MREGDMQRITRRRFLQYGLGVGGALGVPWAMRIPEAHAAPGGKLAKYLEPVPRPGRGHRRRDAERRECSTRSRSDEISRQLHPQLPPTPIWAYDDGSGLARPGRLVRDGGRRAKRHAADRRFHARSSGDVSRLDPGRHAADAARQSRCG